MIWGIFNTNSSAYTQKTKENDFISHLNSFFKRRKADKLYLTASKCQVGNAFLLKLFLRYKKSEFEGGLNLKELINANQLEKHPSLIITTANSITHYKLYSSAQFPHTYMFE